jgi:Tryptophan-rich Synechocystis species C-terminal domain
MATTATDFGPVYPLPFGVSFKVSVPAADPTNTDPINPGGMNFTYTIPDLSAYGVIGWGQGLPAASMNGPNLDPNALLTYNSSLSSGMTAVWSGTTTIAGVGAGSYTGTVHTELVATIISGASGWSPDSWSSPSNDPAVVALIDSGTFAVNLQWLASPTGVPGSFEAMQTFFDDQHAAAGDLQTSSDGEFAGQLVVSADILWQNTSTGQASIWEMDGNALVGGGKVTPNPGTNWRAVGTDDFTGDGKFDILWQNMSTGQASVWEMDGNALVGGGAVTPNPGLSWRAVGTGDFYGAGDSDILWQNTATGQASIWEMNGNSLIGGGKVTSNPGPDWKAVGTGDFHDKGNSDILWQNTNTGQVSIWEMNGNAVIGGGPVTPDPGPSWKAVATGDFAGAGDSDIVFQNATTGQVSIWEMSGTSLVGGGKVSANPGPNWHVIGTGAGGSDILLQNISGATSIWEMNGNTIAGGGPVTPNPGSSWRAVGLT